MHHDTAFTAPVPVEQFAALVAELVLWDYPDTLSLTDRDGVPVRSFEDLHRIVDANEYVADAELLYGVTFTEGGYDAYCSYLNEAVGIAEFMLGW